MTVTSSIPHANAYGGVLLTRCGRVLLREPANHFDGYHWTFAKGKSDKGEQPELTALREVYEETGYLAEIITALPDAYKSSLSSTAIFIMKHLNQQHPYSWETQSTRWVDFAEAKRLISQSTNSSGRQRDLQILRDVQNWFKAKASSVLPSLDEYSWMPATQADWENQPLRGRYSTVPLNLVFDSQQFALLRMGFIPNDQNDKWFSYFADNILYQHRSWTGICIDRIYFEPHQDGGMLATHAEVNRNREEYGETDDEADIQRIREMLAYLATPKEVLQRALSWKDYLNGFSMAFQPNYLGNPNDVLAIFQPYFQVLAQIWWQESTLEDRNKEAHKISLIFSNQNPDYTAMPQWHRVNALGAALIECFELDANYCAGEDLYFIVSEALANIGMHFNQYRNDFLTTAQDSPEHMALVQAVHQLQQFVVQVFLGTHVIEFADKTISNFAKTRQLSVKNQLRGHVILSDTPSLKRFTFTELAIAPGTQLTFKADANLNCTVLNDKQVLFNQQTLSLSRAAILAFAELGIQRKSARGPDYWLYNGQSLTTLRLEELIKPC